MEALQALRRLVAGPDRRHPPAGLRLPPALRLYGTPLGLLALVSLGLANGTYLMDTRGIKPWPAALLSIGVMLPIVLSAAGLRLTAWRLAWPLLFVGVARVTPEESWPWTPVQILAFLTVFTLLTMRESTAFIAWATALSIVPVFVFAPRANAWGVVVLLVALALTGDLLSRRRRAQAQLDEQTRLTEREQDRRAVLEERTRIAREMHDVVAHHMSMIAVQAETAPYRVPGVPDPARAEFQDIAAAAREALTEMRRLLGVLRAEPDRAPLTPQPTLADVPALIANAARAGMPVTCPQSGPPPSHVSAATGLAAYRIVQEALANAARHAPGSPTTVSIRTTTAALLLEICNGPAPVPSAGTPPHPRLPAHSLVDPAPSGHPADHPSAHHDAVPPPGHQPTNARRPAHQEPGPPPDHQPPAARRPAHQDSSPSPGHQPTTAPHPAHQDPGPPPDHQPKTDLHLPPPGSGVSQGGHGLDGMRERALALGGTLDAGRQPDGGYLVAARLPLRSGPDGGVRAGPAPRPAEAPGAAESFVEGSARSGEAT
ncbi:histidine kinase [Actinoplanes sp. RD1]|uniref:histidine kinase n=1 Tax=Actinoplanes sp. RD1 TaxID=3064538 RepID=UPI002742215E|nr:histidine kinase [Actinoplanes sp. RD1]